MGASLLASPGLVISIAGLPGAGKTTLAAGLSDALGLPVISTSAIAALVDPGAGGGMAHEGRFLPAFAQAMADLAGRPAIVDAAPRRRGQVEALPPGAVVLALFCRRDIAIDRMLRRGRDMDAGQGPAERFDEQAIELAWDDSSGWLRRLVPWGRFVNTGQRAPEMVLAGVLAHLRGERREAF